LKLASEKLAKSTVFPVSKSKDFPKILRLSQNFSFWESLYFLIKKEYYA
jgi:hypothetical protein